MKQKLLAIALACYLFSCNSDDQVIKPEEEIPQLEKSNYAKILEEQNTKIENVFNFTKTTTSLNFTVTDQQSNPLPEAKVKINDIEKTTDATGKISFENIEVNNNYVVAQTSKEGYQKSIKTITPSQNGSLQLNISLINEIAPLSLNAKEGGIIENEDIQLNFPKASLIYEDGTPYNDEAVVNIMYFDANKTNFLTISQGKLVGVSNEDQKVGLDSKGMFTVNIYDNLGKELRIANDKKVKVTMLNITDSENEIPFWHLSEKYGVWYEEGKAIRKNNTYEFEVSHFSTFNIGNRIMNTVDLCVLLKKADTILSNEAITITPYNSNYTIVRYTDAEGDICFTDLPTGRYTFKFNQSEKEVNITNNQRFQIKFDDDNVTSFDFCLKFIDTNGNPFKSRFVSLSVLSSPSNLGFGFVNRLTDEEGRVCLKDIRESEVQYFISIYNRNVIFQGQVQALHGEILTTTRNTQEYTVIADVPELPSGTKAASFTDYFEFKIENRTLYLTKKDRAINEGLVGIDNGTGVAISLYNQNYTHRSFLYSGGYTLADSVDLTNVSNITAGTPYILEFKTNLGIMRYEFIMK